VKVIIPTGADLVTIGRPQAVFDTSS
jgi:hypothetical protein